MYLLPTLQMMIQNKPDEWCSGGDRASFITCMFFPDLAQVHRGPTYDLCAPCRALSGGGTYKPYPRTPVAHILRAQYLLSSTFFNRRLKFTMAPFDIIETRNSSIDGPVFSLGDGAHRTAAVKVTLSSVSTTVGFPSRHEIYDC